eukprot:CFRG8379T1
MADESLSKLFRAGEVVVIDLDSDKSNDRSPADQQAAAENAIQLLLKAVQKIRSESVFSPNESLDEIDAESLKYLLTPVYIGSLALKIMDRETRLRNLTAAEEYVVTFLKQCNLLGLLSKEDKEVMLNKPPTDAEAKRQATIKRYKDTKQAKAHLETLTNHIASTSTADGSSDSQLSRNHVLALISVWIHRTCGDLSMLREEKNMLAHMEKIREENGGELPPMPKVTSKPAFKPFLLTKEMVKVFGAGYPSKPTMTIEQAAEREHMLGMHGSCGGHDTVMPTDTVPVGEDDTFAGREAEDVDTYKKRGWDAYTDETPKGSGNRYNKS